MVEKRATPRNAESELRECYGLLEQINDEVLRAVAIGIFAPTGTFVPLPIDHAVAYGKLP